MKKYSIAFVMLWMLLSCSSQKNDGIFDKGDKSYNIETWTAGSDDVFGNNK